MSDSGHPNGHGLGGAVPTGTAREDEPTAAILRRLAGNLGKFVDTYTSLAGEEVRQTKRDTVMAGMLLAAGVAFGFFALALGLTAAVLALALVVPPWLSALILCAAAGLLAGLLAMMGSRRLRFRRLTTLMQHVMEDIRWMRRELLGSA